MTEETCTEETNYNEGTSKQQISKFHLSLIYLYAEVHKYEYFSLISDELLIIIYSYYVLHDHQTAVMELFNDDGRLYVLKDRQWIKVGDGSIIMTIHNHNPSSIIMQLIDKTDNASECNTSHFFRCMAKTKPKGNKAYVLKGNDIKINQTEILAARFKSPHTAISFKNAIERAAELQSQPTLNNDKLGTLILESMTPLQHHEHSVIATDEILQQLPMMLQEWNCTLCTSQNAVESMQCRVCLTPRIEPQIDSDDMHKPRTFALEYRYQSRCPTKQDFIRILTTIESNITTKCDEVKVFEDLYRMAKNLKKTDVKYRTLEPQNPVLQEGLMEIEGVDVYLSYLGFEKVANNKLVCPDDQPSTSVITTAQEVCKDFMNEWKRKKSILDYIPDHDTAELLQIMQNQQEEDEQKGNEEKQEGIQDNEKNAEDGTSKQRELHLQLIRLYAEAHKYRYFSLIPDGIRIIIYSYYAIHDHQTALMELFNDNGAMYVLKDKKWNGFSDDLIIMTIMNHNPSFIIIKKEDEQFTLNTKILETVKNIVNRQKDDDQKQTEQKQEHNENEEYTLRQLVWTITSTSSNDWRQITDVILLCHIVFADSNHLLKLLVERFHGNTSMNGGETVNDDEHRWHIQIKVGSILTSWMKTFWEQDFRSKPQLLEYVQVFFESVETEFNDNKRVQVLLKKMRGIYDTQSMLRCGYQMKNKIIDRTLSKPKNFQITDHRADKLAEQFTLIYFNTFKVIEKREYLEQTWRKSGCLSQNVLNMIKLFRQTVKWVQILILVQQTVRKRSKVLRLCIKIARYMTEFRNFSGADAFYLALISPSIQRLKIAWSRISEIHLQRFSELKKIFDCNDNNWSLLHKLHREACAPAILHFGLIVVDLMGIDEGFVDRRKGTVNIRRLLKLQDMIERMDEYRCAPYLFDEDLVIKSAILDDFEAQQQIDDSFLFKISCSVKKADERKI